MLTRKKLGKELKSKREKKGRSINSFKNIGLVYREVKAIEGGLTNYTIDKLLCYYNALKNENK